jgi:hypothetical protein
MNRNRINSTPINSTRIDSTPISSTEISRQELLVGSPTQDTGGQEFHVTYYDSDCGHARTEVFDDVAAAERFASRVVRDEDDWAVIDPVPLQRGRIAA